MAKSPATWGGLTVLRRLTVLLVVGCSFLSGPAFAGSELRKATSGATELLIPVGPRGTALGAAAAADLVGIDALHWNPAGLAGMEHAEAILTHSEYFADMDVNCGAIGSTWPRFGALALSAKVLSIGEIIETTEDAPEGTGKTFNPTFAVLGLSYARQFTDRVRFGVTANYINERILDVSAHGVAFDLGVQYLAGPRGVSFGLVMKNFGPSMEFRGSGFQRDLQDAASDPTSSQRSFVTSSAAFDLPSYFVLAAAYQLFASGNQGASVRVSFQNNDYTGDNLCGAVEWSYRDVLVLRGSYFGTFEGTTDSPSGGESGSFESGDDLFSGYSLGAGVNFAAGESRFGIDLAWRPVREFFDDTVDIGLRVGF